MLIGRNKMTKEIEEKISEEIDVANYKFQRNIEKVADNYNKAFDEVSEDVGKSLDCIQAYIFHQRKCLDNFLIEIKAIQEKYQKELQDE
jgi:hypothetical protein